MNIARYGHSCAVHKGLLYVIGGLTSDSEYSVEILDISTSDMWQFGPELPHEFYAGQALVYSDTLHVILQESGLIMKLDNNKWQEINAVGDIGYRPVFPAPVVTSDILGC